MRLRMETQGRVPVSMVTTLQVLEVLSCTRSSPPPILQNGLSRAHDLSSLRRGGYKLAMLIKTLPHQKQILKINKNSSKSGNKARGIIVCVSSVT